MRYNHRVLRPTPAPYFLSFSMTLDSLLRLPAGLAACLASCLLTLGSLPAAVGQERGAGGDNPDKKNAEPIFSGPQIGETLNDVPVWMTHRDEQPSTKVNLAELNQEKPIVIAFMHERSRPAFQLARILSAFGEHKGADKLGVYFVVLSEDRSSSETWLRQIRGYFTDSTHLAVADGGIEGPGSLGLNRLVAMTILVAKDQKVTANFALTQVTAASDGPAILKAMNEVSGGGEIPPMERLVPTRQRR